MLFEQIPMIFELLIFTVVILLLFSSKYFAFLDKSEQGREVTIDGLRAFLALGVAYQHMILSYNKWFLGNGWGIVGYPFNDKLAKVAISFFFMISAYILTRKNINCTDEFIKFYINRFFRIAPMAWLSVSICLITAIIFGTNINYDSLLDNLFVWYDAGLLCLGTKPDINSFQGTYLVNAGVMWSLPWEWLLYFSLPIIITLRHKINSFVIAQLFNFIAVYCLIFVSHLLAVFILCFSLGVTARDIKPFIQIPKIVNNIIILFCLCIIFLRNADPFEISTIVIEFIMFVCVCLGGDFFGILRTKGAIRLGEVSYSIYLIHGIFWFYMNKMVLSIHLSHLSYAVISLIFLILICVVSCMTFILVERKGVSLGKHISKKYVVHL